MRSKRVTKKIFTSVVHIAFLFAAICLANVSCFASGTSTTVQVLQEVDGRAFTEITAGQSIDYAAEGNHKDSTGTDGAGRGTISYSKVGDKAVVILDNIDLSTENGLLSADIGSEDLDIVLNGINSITSNNATILASNNNLRFVGSGSLTISQNTNDSAITTLSTGNIEFATDSEIIINQSAAAPAISSSGNLVVSSGSVNVLQIGKENAVEVGGDTTIKGGTLNITQNTSDNAINTTGSLSVVAGSLITNNTAPVGNGLNVAGKINLTGGMIENIISNDSTGIPIYAADTITINGANVRAIGNAGGSPYGISTATGKNIIIYKSSVVEAVGNINAINPDNLIIDDTADWIALAGQSEESSARLPEVKGSDITKAITDAGYDYVRLYNEIVLKPTSVTYDRNTAAREHTEITVVMSEVGNMLTEIAGENRALQVGKDYVLNYNGTDLTSVTFQVREYLETLGIGTHILTFKFSNGLVSNFAINVVDTSIA